MRWKIYSHLREIYEISESTSEALCYQQGPRFTNRENMNHNFTRINTKHLSDTEHLTMFSVFSGVSDWKIVPINAKQLS